MNVVNVLKQTNFEWKGDLRRTERKEMVATQVAVQV